MKKISIFVMLLVCIGQARPESVNFDDLPNFIRSVKNKIWDKLDKVGDVERINPTDAKDVIRMANTYLDAVEVYFTEQKLVLEARSRMRRLTEEEDKQLRQLRRDHDEANNLLNRWLRDLPDQYRKKITGL